MNEEQRGFERAIIGAMLIDRVAADKAFESVNAQDFYYPEYRAMFRAIEYCVKEHDHIDQLLVVEALSNMKVLDDVGGEIAVMTIIDETLSAANIEIFCRKLKDYSARHRLEQMYVEHMKAVHDMATPIEDTIAKISEGSMSILAEKKTRSYVDIDELMSAAYTETSRRYENRGMVIGVPTGLKDIDRITGGFQAGDLIVLAGRTSQGKTALALNILANAAKADDPAALFSLEMPSLQIGMRLLTSESRYNVFRAHRADAEEPPFQRLSDAANRLINGKIFVCDMPGLSMPRFGAILRRMVRENGVKLAVVDYLQLMEGSNKESRQLEVTSISRGLKRYAKQFSIPILALSQFSRKIDEQDRPPRLSDLRESGAIEQDADAVMALYAPKYDEIQEPGLNLIPGQEREYRYLVLLKNRNGQTGNVLIHWTGEYMRFADIEKDEDKYYENHSYIPN